MCDMILINGIVKESVVDGPGIRYVIFTQDCHYTRKGHHNPQTHSLLGGYYKSIDKIIKEIIHHPMINGVTFSGGESLLQFKELLTLTESCRAIRPELNFILHTGYTFDEIKDMMKTQNDTTLDSFIKNMDFIVTDRFAESRKFNNLKFKGSKNRIVYAIHKDRHNLIKPYVDNNWDTFKSL